MKIQIIIILYLLIYSDIDQTIFITQSSSSETLPLKCIIKSSDSNKSDSGGLSTGGFIAIVCSILGALLITGILYLFISKKSTNSIPMANNTTLENTSDNINEKK